MQLLTMLLNFIQLLKLLPYQEVSLNLSMHDLLISSVFSYRKPLEILGISHTSFKAVYYFIVIFFFSLSASFINVTLTYNKLYTCQDSFLISLLSFLLYFFLYFFTLILCLNILNNYLHIAFL